MHLHDLTIKKFHNGLINKDFSAFEITRAYFDWIEKRDKEIGAYLHLDKDSTFAQAEKVDIAVAKGEDVGLLAGAPLAVKDNILIQGLPCTAASKALENYRAAYDATIIQKLKTVGAVFLGKTNLDEFAMGSSTENSAYKITKNPHDLKRVPGGSSGGSAAAVAGSMALAALGSDTGGSIREPASFCGVVGLKPTYGAVSRFGLIAMASSLDQVGPLAKTVEDTAILFQEMSGVDSFDSTSVKIEYGDNILNPSLEKIKKLKVGLPEEYFIGGVEPLVMKAVEEAIEKLKSLGLEFTKISLPHTKYALSCYYIIMFAEVSSNLARYDGIRYSQNTEYKIQDAKLSDIYLNERDKFGAEVRRRVLLGSFVLSSGYYDAYYEKAQRVRRLIQNDFENAFKDADVILTPVAPTAAFKIGEKISDPFSMYLSDIFTVPVNLAGLPAISIPVTSYQLPVTNLPIGFQLIGQKFREADILGIGQYYEKL